MNTTKQVEELAANLAASGVPLSDAVWETACACDGFPYVYGAWGLENCTPGNRKKRKNPDHPKTIENCQVLNGSKSSCSGCKWYPGGERVLQFDCRGFTHDMLDLFGIRIEGQGCTSQWTTDSNWVAKDTINRIPDDILVCLFQQKEDQLNKMEHTGFGYHGMTVECQKGVQIKSKREKKWTHWAIPVGIDGDVPIMKPTLRKGSTGPYVVECQKDLISLGYDLSPYGADGKYGNKTAAAVAAFQAANPPLVQDGICGPATWAALDAAVAPEPTPQPVTTLYTVHIPHCTKYQAEGLVKQYPGATMTQEV